jgi:hypothetical protein
VNKFMAYFQFVDTIRTHRNRQQIICGYLQEIHNKTREVNTDVDVKITTSQL